MKTKTERLNGETYEFATDEEVVDWVGSLSNFTQWVVTPMLFEEFIRKVVSFFDQHGRVRSRYGTSPEHWLEIRRVSKEGNWLVTPHITRIYTD